MKIINIHPSARLVGIWASSPVSNASPINHWIATLQESVVLLNASDCRSVSDTNKTLIGAMTVADKHEISQSTVHSELIIKVLMKLIRTNSRMLEQVWFMKAHREEDCCLELHARDLCAIGQI